MKKKRLDLPKEGNVVIVTAKIKGIRTPDEPVGTCVTTGKVGKCAVLFESGDMWWGSPAYVFPYALHAASEGSQEMT